MAIPTPDVVRLLPYGSLQLICPNCGSPKRLSGAESTGKSPTTCPSDACSFSHRTNWREWLRRHAVHK